MATTTSDGMTGALSGTGHDQLRLTVVSGAVPATLPAELEGLAAPVYDDAGQLYDWRLDPTHAGHVLEAGDYERFRSWRSGFATERFIGERALVLAFLDWAAERTDVSALQILRLDHAHLDYHKALELGLQLGNLRRLTAASGATGIGLYATGSKPIRGFLPGSEPAIVLALGPCSLTMAADGLTLHRAEGPFPLTGWRVQGDAVLARGLDGELELPATGAGRLLRIVGRQAAGIEVKHCPLSTLVAPLLSFGKEAADLAGEARTGLYLRSRWN